MAFALAAGIGAIGSLASGALGMFGSQSASKEQAQAAQNNLNFQTNLLGLNEKDLSPFMFNGRSADATLTNLLTPGANMESTLESLPGFQFQSQWGTKTAQNALAAEGLGGSTGPLAKTISDYNNGLASTSYGNYVSQLLAASGLGLNAAEGITGATNTASAAGGNALTNQGNALASGSLGTANALGGALTGAGGSASNALILSQLLGNAGGGGGIFGGSSGLDFGATQSASDLGFFS